MSSEPLGYSKVDVGHDRGRSYWSLRVSRRDRVLHRKDTNEDKDVRITWKTSQDVYLLSR